MDGCPGAVGTPGVSCSPAFPRPPNPFPLSLFCPLPSFVRPARALAQFVFCAERLLPTEALLSREDFRAALRDEALLKVGDEIVSFLRPGLSMNAGKVDPPRPRSFSRGARGVAPHRLLARAPLSPHPLSSISQYPV